MGGGGRGGCYVFPPGGRPKGVGGKEADPHDQRGGGAPPRHSRRGHRRYHRRYHRRNIKLRYPTRILIPIFPTVPPASRRLWRGGAPPPPLGRRSPTRGRPPPPKRKKDTTLYNSCSPRLSPTP